METTQNRNLDTNIDVEALTFGDWQAIASACDNSPQWGYYKWVENSSSLSELSLEDWENIASVLGYSDRWGYSQWREHRK